MKKYRPTQCYGFLAVMIGASCFSSTMAAAPPPRIQAEVDATQVARHLLQSKLTIPVTPGELVLWFPKWIPGIHGPGAQIGNLAGLTVTSTAGEPVSWQRDPNELYRFLVDVPAGTETIQVDLTYLANQPTKVSTGVDTQGNADLLVINFNTCLLYPEGATAGEIPISLRVRLPQDWQFGTALTSEPTNSGDGWHQFAPSSLETIIDSPLVAGRHLRKLQFETPEFPVTRMHFVSESPAALAFDEAQAQRYRRLSAEALNLFGGTPFSSYDYLVVCSEQLPAFGLEHCASSLNSIPEQALVDDDQRKGWHAYLLPHELVHAWCGKYRRPEGMTRADYHTNKQTELLWIYEGLTQYLGQVLAVRSGLMTFDGHLESLAGRVGYLSQRAGRKWRSLADTAIANYTLRGSSPNWNDLRRGQDYYDEGALFWLEVDCLLRELTQGKRSLDDFCQEFFHKSPSDPKIKPYGLIEVVDLLSSLAPHDWEGLIRRRIYQPLDQLQLDALWHAGYEYTYTDKRPEFVKLREKDHKTISAEHSLGVRLKEDGTVEQVAPGSPSDKAGLATKMKIMGIDRRKFTPERFRSAIKETPTTRQIELLVLEGDTFRTLVVTYADGKRYPVLQRVVDRPDLLRKIYAPRAGDPEASVQ
jgi:predicted metalloprotease with PDZ domain